MLRPRSIVAILATALGLTTVTARDGGDIPFDEQGYVGLRLRDIPGDHAVASWILPGPMEGRGLTCAGFDIARPDLVVAVDGRRMDADAFRDYVRARRPGETIRIAYRKSNARGGRIPKEVDHAETVHEIVVIVAARGDWSGTIGRPRSSAVETRFDTPPLLAPDDPANVLGGAIDAHGLAAPLATLRGVFVEWRDDAPDHHELSRVRAPFAQPFRLPELAELITAPMRDAPGAPVDTAVRIAGANLDVPVIAPDGPRPSAGDAGPLPDAVVDALTAMSASSRRALGPLWQDEAFARDCAAFLRVPGETFYLEGEGIDGHLDVIRASMDVDFDALLRALAAAEPLSALDAVDLPAAPPHAPPAALAAAVTGDVIAARDLGANIGWVVIGADGPNRYDMAKLGAVIDVGGDDVYHASGLRLGVRAIVDLAGDDVYTGTPDQGPGGALLGVSFIDDRGGDDRYEGALLSSGAACFGMSLLLDRGGADVHTGTEWSQGAACYGAGMLFDLGPGADVYSGAFLCQGVGGPRGFGCIVDEGGRDLYRVNGPTPSAYGTAAVYQSFSQGMGFGYRHYAAGGIGVISDLGGDDRYEAGEFAQGGAYYFGLGILHDAAGRDLYYGNRYGQGFGVHQAHGALVDDGGDDVYWSMTAASQGAAWDIGAGLLLDRAGDDTYQCDGLGQGGASQQGIALLVDLAGRDRYAARGGATQGQSGANDYHFGETGAYSFSVLLDLGGADDVYSRGRANDATTVTGRANADAPASSSLHGLVIDR